MVRVFSSTLQRLAVFGWVDVMEAASVSSSVRILQGLRVLQDASTHLVGKGDAAGRRFASFVRTRERSDGRRPRLAAVVSRQGSTAWDEAADVYFSDAAFKEASSGVQDSLKGQSSEEWKKVLGKARARQAVDEKKSPRRSGEGDGRDTLHSRVGRGSRSDFGSRREVGDRGLRRKERGRESSFTYRQRDGGRTSGFGGGSRSRAGGSDNSAFAAREWEGVGFSDRVGAEDDDFSGEDMNFSAGRSVKDYTQQKTRQRRGGSANRWQKVDEEEEEEDMEEEREEDEEEGRMPQRHGYRRGQPEQSGAVRAVGEAVYGVSPIKAAFQACRRKFYKLYVQVGMEEKLTTGKRKDKAAVAWVLNAAKSLGVQTVVTSKHNLNLLADNRPHQGLILDASPLELVLIEELEYPEAQEGARAPVWVALDEIMDPQNFGAILRSAFFLGANGVVVCAKNSAPLSGVVSKASSGALEAMEVQYCKNMVRFLDRSVQNGWQAVGASTDRRSVSVWDLPAGNPTILVLGNEGKGLRTNVRRACSQMVSISGAVTSDSVSSQTDITGYTYIADEEAGEITSRRGSPEVEAFLRPTAVDSLNVSVAAGILLHQLLTRPVQKEDGLSREEAPNSITSDLSVAN